MKLVFRQTKGFTEVSSERSIEEIAKASIQKISVFGGGGAGCNIVSRSTFQSSYFAGFFLSQTL